MVSDVKIMRSYLDAASLYRKHKFRRAGVYPPQAPIYGESVWLINDNDDYELAIEETLIGIFSPDNKFTFTASPLRVKARNSALTTRLPAFTPFHLKAETTTFCPSVGHSTDFTNFPMPMVHLFKGLTFDFNKGEWVNAKSYHGIPVSSYDPVHTMTKNFRQELELRAKLGALNKLCQEVNSEPGGLANAIDNRPDWGDPRYITELVRDMKDQKYLGDGVRHLVRSLRYGVTKPVLWFKPHAAPNASPRGVLDLFDNVMEKLHLEVCKLCGVYGDDTDL